MLNEGEGNDLPHKSKEPEHVKIKDIMAMTNVNKETGGLICNEDDSPGLKDMSHDSKATSMIGQGNVHLNDTSGQHERSVLMLVLPTRGTQLTLQPLWILWNLPIQWSHLPLIQVTKWHLSTGSMYTRNT